MIDLPHRARFFFCCILLAAKVLAGESPVMSVDQAAMETRNAKEDFARIEKKMTREEVFALLGGPSKSESRMSGKQFIPFYFAGDRRRLIWTYDGLGVIYFSHNTYTDKVEVIEIIPEKSEKN